MHLAAILFRCKVPHEMSVVELSAIKRSITWLIKLRLTLEAGLSKDCRCLVAREYVHSVFAQYFGNAVYK